MSTFDDGEFSCGEGGWDEEEAYDSEAVQEQALAEAAALGLLLPCDAADHPLPLQEASQASSSSHCCTPERTLERVPEDTPAKREAPEEKDAGRKRLRRKSSCPYKLTVVPAPTEGITVDGHPVKSHPLFVKYLQLDPALRRLASKRLSQQKYRMVSDLVSIGKLEVLGEVLTYSGDKSDATKQVELKFCGMVARDHTRPPADRGYALSVLVQHERDMTVGCFNKNSAPTVRNVPSALLTYNGDLGIVDVASLKLPVLNPSSGSSELTLSEKFEILREMDIDQVARLLEKNKQVTNFFEQLQTIAVNTTNQLHTPHWAVTVEVCLKTLASSDILRVHGHMWITLKGQSLELKAVAIDAGKCVPFANWQALHFLSGTSTRSAASAMAGAFYCTVQKRGTVLKNSTCVPWQDFSVRDCWITSMFVAGKICFQVAREAYLKTVHRAAANVAQLEFVHKEQKKLSLQRRILAIENELRQSFLPWHSIPAVGEWKRQYLEAKGRYNFLVLDGASCFGKTKYAFSLNPPERTFYCDCTAGVPDMRGFDSVLHSAIIFDELSPKAGIALKKCLQASNEPVMMAVSPTMVSSYIVHLWRAQLIVCTNLWSSGLKKLKKVDRDWLQRNSVYVAVREPLWVENEGIQVSYVVEACLRSIGRCLCCFANQSV